MLVRQGFPTFVDIRINHHRESNNPQPTMVVDNWLYDEYEMDTFKAEEYQQ